MAPVTDEATGYKLVGTELMRSIGLQARGFDLCPELTGRILRRGGRIADVAIRYSPRGWADGKKITARDGLIAIWVLVRERLRPAPRAAELIDVIEVRDGDDPVEIRGDAERDGG